MADNYDQLSPLGAKQASALGHHWAAAGRQFDRVLVGPLSRQIDTEWHLRQAYSASGIDLPIAERVESLREHEANNAFAAMLPRIAARDDEYGQMARNALGVHGSKRDRLRAFSRFVGPWAEGRLEGGKFESFATFQSRIHSCLANIMAEANSGESILAVTSGGVIAAVVGMALQTAPAHIMKLNGVVFNGSYHEFRFRSGQQNADLSLFRFNAIPHLPPPLQTQI